MLRSWNPSEIHLLEEISSAIPIEVFTGFCLLFSHYQSFWKFVSCFSDDPYKEARDLINNDSSVLDASPAATPLTDSDDSFDATERDLEIEVMQAKLVSLIAKKKAIARYKVLLKKKIESNEQNPL